MKMFTITSICGCKFFIIPKINDQYPDHLHATRWCHKMRCILKKFIAFYDCTVHLLSHNLFLVEILLFIFFQTYFISMFSLRQIFNFFLV